MEGTIVLSYWLFFSFFLNEKTPLSSHFNSYQHLTCSSSRFLKYFLLWALCLTNPSSLSWSFPPKAFGHWRITSSVYFLYLLSCPWLSQPLPEYKYHLHTNNYQTLTQTSSFVYLIVHSTSPINDLIVHTLSLTQIPHFSKWDQQVERGPNMPRKCY